MIVDPLLRLALVVYLLCGLLLACKNARSEFFRRSIENADKHGMLFWNCLGFVIGVLLWPLGWIPIAWIFKGRKKDGSKEREL